MTSRAALRERQLEVSRGHVRNAVFSTATPRTGGIPGAVSGDAARAAAEQAAREAAEHAERGAEGSQEATAAGLLSPKPSASPADLSACRTIDTPPLPPPWTVEDDGACWVAPMIDGWFAVLKKASPRSLGKNQPEGSPKGKERFLRLIDTPFPRPSNVEYPMRREQGSAGETLRRKQ